MKFSLISDMHVDHPQKKTPYELLEKNVIVAGDTSNGLLGLKFLNKLRNKGFDVHAVDGNHEHYMNVSQGRSIPETTERFRQENPAISRMEGIPVISANGWYVVNNEDLWFGYMNDGPHIVGKAPHISGSVVSNWAMQDHFFLADQLANLSEKCIVVTHTAPCRETLDPKFDGHYSNEWYHNPLMYRLMDKFKDKILVWCHGHTHTASEKVVEGVRVVCNPRGYPGENPSWEPLTVEV